MVGHNRSSRDANGARVSLQWVHSESRGDPPCRFANEWRETTSASNPPKSTPPPSTARSPVRGSGMCPQAKASKPLRISFEESAPTNPSGSPCVSVLSTASASRLIYFFIQGGATICRPVGQKSRHLTEPSSHCFCFEARQQPLAISSRMPRKQSQDGFERCFGSCLWFPSYFAAGYGAAPLSLIKTYGENHEKPD